MGTLKLSGSLDAGPNTGGESFPASSFSTPLSLRTVNGFQAATGVLTRNVNVLSPNWVTLYGVGAGDALVRALFLYLKTDSPVNIRYTLDDGSGGLSAAVTLPVQGLLIFEFPTARALRLLEAQGSTRMEYLLAGNE